MTRWEIGLEPWVLADGNYDPFYVGQLTEFAVGFYPQSQVTLSRSDKSAVLIKPGLYSLSGEVVYFASVAWVVDFGLMAYAELHENPENAPVYENAPVLNNVDLGSQVRMNAYLFVDPFMYFEELVRDPAIPAMIYVWQIERIVAVDEPLIETRTPAGIVYVGDETRTVYKDVQSTTAKESPWDSKTTVRNWLLHCLQLEKAPQRRRASNP